MKEYTIVTKDTNEEVVKTEVLKMGDSDRVILTVGDSVFYPTSEMINNFHRYFCEALKNEEPVISLPNFVKVEVLKLG